MLIIRVTFKICAVLGAQGICATGFRHAQGNQRCAKIESHTTIVTFETNAISITSSIHALCLLTVTPSLQCIQIECRHKCFNSNAVSSSKKYCIAEQCVGYICNSLTDGSRQEFEI